MMIYSFLLSTTSSSHKNDCDPFTLIHVERRFSRHDEEAHHDRRTRILLIHRLHQEIQILGSIFTPSLKDDKDIKRRVSQACGAFAQAEKVSTL